MMYVLIPLCLCLAAVFLWQEHRKNYVPAVVLKGLASGCFVGLGLLLSPGTQTARLIVAGLILGCIADVLLNLRYVFEKKGQLIFLAGIATDQADPNAEVDRLAGTLLWALEQNYQPPQNFFGVGGLKIFRDLIFQMRGMMRADHKFYKAHGFYDFPQKRRGRIAAMYLVGAMMNNKRLRGKLGGRMTEGMTLPYRKVLGEDPNANKERK